MELLENIKSNAAKRKQTIVLPESVDERVLKAAAILTVEEAFERL